ncbi:hypothetical protein AX15_003442 [Amanita polypyramis BW_CC]|nr:hypothetical protein AX15_003442 [Amanita polypyramis BW_CC]
MLIQYQQTTPYDRQLDNAGTFLEDLDYATTDSKRLKTPTFSVSTRKKTKKGKKKESSDSDLVGNKKTRGTAPHSLLQHSNNRHFVLLKPADTQLSMTARNTPLTLSAAQVPPPEIIHQVFEHFPTPLFTNNPARFPWYLGQVCSSWRAEFLSMRRVFWNEIVVRSGTNGNRNVLDMVRMFLACNEGETFSFELRADPRGGEYFRAVIDLLASKSIYWRRATLAISISEVPVLYSARGKLLHLESLELYIEERDEDIPGLLTDTFGNAPSLTRMTLRYLSTWKFDWSRMMMLELICGCRNTTNRLPVVLSQATSLERLIIHEDFDFQARAPITLPGLKRLEVREVRILAGLTTPSLEHLHVDFADDDRPNLNQVLRSFFLRSNCPIRYLDVDRTDAAAVMQILPYTPDIISLHLDNIKDVNNVFERLNEAHAGGEPQLAYLQSLKLVCCWPSFCVGRTGSDQELFNLIAWRGKRAAENKVKRLQRLTMVNVDSGPVYIDLEDILREDLQVKCEEEGVRLGYGDERELYVEWQAHDRTEDPYEFFNYC